MTEWLHSFMQTLGWPIIKPQSCITTFDQEIDIKEAPVSTWLSQTQLQEQEPHRANILTPRFPVSCGSHKRIGNVHVLSVQLSKKSSLVCQTPGANRLCKSWHKRSGVYDKEQAMSDLFTTVTSWKTRRNRRKQTVNNLYSRNFTKRLWS